MTDTFEEDSYEGETVILESEVKAAPKVLGRNKLPGVDGILIELFQATETESVKIPTTTKNKYGGNSPMVYRLATFHIHLYLQEKGYQGMQ